MSRVDQGLLLASALALFLSFFPWGQYVLYPFKLFTTWVHECGHAFAALLMSKWVGGGVQNITLHADTSGLTHYTLGDSRLARGFVASWGYLGATAVGCLLLWAARSAVPATWVFWTLGSLMVLSVVFWVRNVFGVVSVLVLATILVLATTKAKGPYLQFGLQFLAVQTALNALFDLRTLFGLSSSTASDAKTLESLFLLPAPVWVLLWIASSAAAFFWTWQHTGARR